MGVPLSDTEEYFDFLDEGRVLVQVNGDPGEPVKGHSRFYFKYTAYELMFSPTGREPAEAFSRYGLSAQAAQFLNVTTGRHGDHHGEHGAIFKVKVDEDTAPGSVAHLITKGRLFALHERYSNNFEMACQRETMGFGAAPYSYGLHYNCNTFVYNVLRRLRQSIT
jgi:hypothetical protein